MSQIDTMEKLQQQLEKLRLQNANRQKRFYEINKVKLNQERMALYHKGRALMKAGDAIASAAPTGKLTGNKIIIKIKKVPSPPAPFKEGSEGNQGSPGGSPGGSPNVWTDFKQGFESKGFTNKYYSGMQTMSKILASAGYDLKKFLNIKGKGNIAAKLKTLLSNALNGNKPYAINSQRAYAQALLVYITQFQKELSVKDETRESINELIKIYNVSSIIQNEQKQQEIYPKFEDWIDKIEDFYGDTSVEAIIANLYNEVTARDDFHLHVTENVKNTRKKGDKNNYITIPRSILYASIFLTDRHT